MGEFGQDGSSHRAQTRAPVSSAGVTVRACLHHPSCLYGRFHGTAITAPGNTLLIKANGLGCGRKDGWWGGSSPPSSGGLQAALTGEKDVGVHILGIKCLLGLLQERQERGTGSLCSNLRLESDSRAFHSTHPQRHRVVQWSEEAQDQSPRTAR